MRACLSHLHYNCCAREITVANCKGRIKEALQNSAPRQHKRPWAQIQIQEMKFKQEYYFSPTHSSPSPLCERGTGPCWKFWNLHLWRYSKARQLWCWAICSSWLGLCTKKETRLLLCVLWLFLGLSSSAYIALANTHNTSFLHVLKKTFLTISMVSGSHKFSRCFEIHISYGPRVKHAILLPYLNLPISSTVATHL